MVATHAKNKTTHPAAPVMSDNAKIKAGILTKRHSKKGTKDDTIWALEARIASSENPGGEQFTKEPLVRAFQSLRRALEC